MADKKRTFSIDLGQLIMRALADELDPDDVIAVLKEHLDSENSIKRTREAAQRSY